MKYFKIAAIALATMPAVTLAQSSSNVVMFGILDTSVNYVDRSGGVGSTMVLNSGMNGQSRFGVRGSEDLGGGMSALFHIEAAVQSDTGAGAGAGGGLTFQRRSVVGLSGNFGTVWLGRDYTPGFQAASGADVAFVVGWQYGLYGTTLLNWTADASAVRGIRWDNGIHYVSPSFGGLVVRAAYGMGESVTTPTSSGNNIGLSLRYDQGPVNAFAFYHDMNDPGGLTTKTKQMGLGGGYNFGSVRLSAGYSVNDPAGANKFTGTNLGVAFKAGNGWVMGQMHRMAESASGAVGNTLAVSYVYSLSKRTDLTVSAGMQRNNATGNFALRASDNQVAPGAVGADPKAIGFGIAHKF